jgi:membrane protease YdiL (CAAX protease family)
MYRLLLVSHTPGELVLVIVTVAVVPALSEEILFRGLVQTDLDRIMVGWKSAVVAGVIFGLYHVNPFSLIPIVGIGVLFGLIVHRSGTIVLAMAAHFLNNLLATVALSMNLDDDFLITAPQGGAGALAIALNTGLFAVVFVALMYYFIRITKPPVPA